MILEGIVTTISAAGEINIAPMGPRLNPAAGELRRFELRRSARARRMPI